MFDLTYVDRVDQNIVNPLSAPVPVGPECIDIALHLTETSQLFIKIKDELYLGRPFVTYLQGLHLWIRVNLVTPGDHTAHPHALLLGGCDLIANTLCSNFSLKLGEGQQYIQSKPPHGGRSVKGLSD